MKTIDIDWTALLDIAKPWESLSLPGRGLAIELGATQASDADAYGPHLDALVAAGMLELFKEGARARPAEAFRPALKVLRLMNRVPVFVEPSAQTLEDYLLEILTSAERAALVERDPWQSKHMLPIVVGSRAYLMSFLDSDDAALWERRRLPDDYYRSSFTDTGAVLDEPGAVQDLRRLLRTLMGRTDAVAFIDLSKAVGRMSRRRLADAIKAGLRYALCFAGFAEGRPALGIWPTISERLHREPPPRPAPVEPETSTCIAWGVEDVIQLLVFCSEPQRLRTNDLQLFAKAERELAALLVPMPAWLLPEEATLQRIREARRLAEHQGLLSTAGEEGRTLRLELTDQGRNWLALPASDRAREFLEPIRMGDETDSIEVDYESWKPPSERAAETKLPAAFESLDGPVLLGQFLRYQAQCANPLLQAADIDILTSRTAPTTEETLEEEWSDRLSRCIFSTLLPFGGVRIGRLEEKYTFELTDVGRYLLKLTDTLDWPDAAEEASILVQPDFEIVFLVANPSIEASITRFAERIGQGVGALFRLTRQSVQAATNAGLTRDEILATLDEASKVALPDNVTREIIGWCKQCVRLAWEPAQLLRCPDEETAARTLSAAKGKLEIVSPTVLALANVKQLTAITNACRKAGIFLDQPEAEPRRKTKPAKRRRRWGW